MALWSFRGLSSSGQFVANPVGPSWTRPILPGMSLDWLLGTVRREENCQPKSNVSPMEHQQDPLLQLETVVKDLRAGFDALRAEARAEGYLFVERLFTEWMSYTNRFDREGEALLAAHMNGVLAGIGGITIEPVVPGAVRMRRFYIRRVFRRNRVGHRLATALLYRVDVGRTITVNAAPASFSFWESVGFQPDHRDGHRHVLIKD